MLRFYLRLAIIPVLLFTAALLLIHAQPYDDHRAHELHNLLAPEDCPAPCFMGIRPGVTTSKEAITLLQNHAWVAEVLPINTESPYQIWWVWNQNAPDFFEECPYQSNLSGQWGSAFQW